LDPDLDFANGETCTVTILAAQVSDQDTDDPPDAMSADYPFSFTTIAVASGWVINEILADPDSANGDANGDSIVNTIQDEFIEIVNNTGNTANISGWELSDGVGVKHTFSADSVVADQCSIVVFAGGSPAGKFGGATVQTASSGGLGLNNSGDTVTLNDGIIDQVIYTYGGEGGDNQSLTRDPDITGPDPLIKHSVASGSNGALFSPGTRVDGSLFDGCSIPASIQEIQFTTDPAGNSPYAGLKVTTEGVVTAIFADGVFIQDGSGPWSGLYLYKPDGSPSIGDRVQVTGNVQEYYSLTEIAFGGTVTVLSSGNELPTPDLLSSGVVSDEQWESVLVRVESVEVTNDNLGYGEWEVDDGSGGVRVDDLGSYGYIPQTGDLLDFVQGPLNYTFDDFKIEPRYNDDIGSVTSPGGACGDAFVPIYDIQGSGPASPLDGSDVSVEGVVTGDFQGDDELKGFYIQDSVGDGDPATSDGIFVFAPGSPDVSVGDNVRVAGRVVEYNNLTEISNVGVVLVCQVGGEILPTSVDLPADLEPYEGMLVTFPEELTASQNYFQGRYGQVTLSSEGRLFNPTNIYLPGSAEAIALAAENLQRMLVLDDGTTAQNPNPIPYIGADNTLRAGDTVTGLTGVVDYGLISSDPISHYRLQPTQPVNFTRVNERTTAPEEVGGRVKVASFNVLNYFNGDGLGGGFPTSRGASTAEEFTRQRVKIIGAIVAMDADVIGLMEIENDGYGPTSAIQDLVNGLNDAVGAGTYAFIDPGVAQIGADEIAVGLIYKPGKVMPLGPTAILDSSVDPLFDSTRNRPAPAQTFAENATGQKFIVVVNHLKSKGSSCDDIGDPDTGDGQGNCNLTRTRAALALTNWLVTDPTGSNDPDFIIIGDLNSYAMEDPITTIEVAGYTNLIKEFVGTWAYSYVFDGQAGYLDHALASPTLTEQVTGTTEWHINTDEPSVIDYNTEFKPQDLYTPTPYRASDHDPVIVGLKLVPQCNGANATIYVDENGKIVGGPRNGRFYKGFLLGTHNDDVIVGTDGKDRVFGFKGDDVICGSGGKDLLFGGRGHDFLFGGNDRDILKGEWGNDSLDGGDGRDLCHGGPGADTAALCEIKVGIP
ncbi:MAG: ExeM/NucH family extracellular endonuclease, partial [Anaerolineae bacterium]|nr:ExeM/NucH family extracellular endonuclease [Anaerolineae bacterium]